MKKCFHGFRPVELLSNATIHKDVRHGKPEVERWYLDEVKHMTDDEFRSHFRMTRGTVYKFEFELEAGLQMFTNFCEKFE